MVKCLIPELGSDVSALLLDSLGRRVAQGFSFAWSRAEGARLTDPNGKVIHLRIDNHVPVLEEGCNAESHKPLQGVMESCPSVEPEENDEGSEHVDIIVTSIVMMTMTSHQKTMPVVLEEST
eukprot:4781812-Amphidinium_carterae.6